MTNRDRMTRKTGKQEVSLFATLALGVSGGAWAGDIYWEQKAGVPLKHQAGVVNENFSEAGSSTAVSTLDVLWTVCRPPAGQGPTSD